MQLIVTQSDKLFNLFTRFSDIEISKFKSKHHLLAICLKYEFEQVKVIVKLGDLQRFNNVAFNKAT